MENNLIPMSEFDPNHGLFSQKQIKFIQDRVLTESKKIYPSGVFIPMRRILEVMVPLYGIYNRRFMHSMDESNEERNKFIVSETIDSITDNVSTYILQKMQYYNSDRDEGVANLYKIGDNNEKFNKQLKDFEQKEILKDKILGTFRRL
ncbi:112L [Cherax quadricarinatus iridovirus]|nr:112L [Cherax quadricarinatus iridovirus]UPA43422.1 112L [Iridovirus CN01]ASZ85092.1 112L [Cherax quadricarinatus iridovirus]UPA43498.1 112L [Iridovirus CN01]UPA43694.1 112L [Iridovirus CN01]UPA43856.1 112L [Iridovirus CN01]